MVDSFRLRLDFGIHATQDVQSMSVIDKHIEFVIPYTENSIFADVLRYIIEKEQLGGHLLELLEAQNDGRRDELYLLLYSKKCATLIQPYWNRIRRQDVKSNITRLKLQLYVGDEVIKCQKLVHEFISEYRLNNNSKKSTTITDGKLARNRKRKRDDSSNSDNILCIDMKLIVKKICISYKPKPDKIRIMLCEEHWKYCNKLLSCNVLCHAPRRLLTSNNRAKHMTEQRHKKLLKSFLINDFIKNKQLLAIAFLIPSALILRGIDTNDGIQISVDKPSMCQSRVINLLRPAVLRQYFGLDLDIPAERDDLVWRSSYGSGSGTTSVGINPRHWTTREMTYPMKIIAKYVYQYLKRQFANDNAIDILQFNHITILYYYQKKIHIDKRRLHEIMLGYHTDNLYNHSGNFIQSSNSQAENTFTALLTLGDTRKLNFRRQFQCVHPKTEKRRWINDDSSVWFSMKNNSLFLLDPRDEKPTQVSPEKPVRHQHGNVKFPSTEGISAVIALRTVSTRALVYKDTGKLFLKSPPANEPESGHLLEKFRQEKMLHADDNLKEKWLGACSRHLPN